jgi:hypothetical protein
MNKKICCVLVIILSIAAVASGQTRYRSGVFLHHSTGGCIWGPNGGQVFVPMEIAMYNRAHGLSGSDSVKMVETWWPSGDNEWTTWHDIFEDRSSTDNIQSFLDDYPVVMIKSCFPSANMSGPGSVSDTLSPGVKSVANYKWHWRSIVHAMMARPQNVFIIWTNAPQVSGSTNASEALISDAFCRWAKDTLAAGLDPLVGEFPRNIFVFDFFHLLAGANGMLPRELASGSSDSHPNATATALVAPQLVTQVFDAAMEYEEITGIAEEAGTVPVTTCLLQNYPNPFNPVTTLQFSIGAVSREPLVATKVRLAVYDMLGREVAVLVNEGKQPGNYEMSFDGAGLPSGVYLCRLTAGEYTASRRMVLLR